jgi:hypothetical protein
MAKQKIIFGEWLPDQPGITGAVMDAVNCYPVTNGYAPLRDAADYSNNAGQNLLVSFAGKFAGASSLFAAGATQIYKFDSSNTNLTALTTTGYSAVDSWDITQFGSKMILANGVDQLQAYDLGSSTYFEDLAAAAPAAHFVTVVRDFVVAANVGGEENKVYWSDINDETDWTPGAASQSDTQLMPDGGDITGLAGGEYGLIFLERAIYRMTYSGSPYFFQFDAISRTLGCISNGSVAQFGGLTYFLSDDGFYVCDGKSVKNIGVEKINRWFFENCILAEIPTKMSSTIDPVRKLVIWNFTNSFGGRYLLYYSIDLNKWSYGNTDVVSLSYGLTPSATLEQLDDYSSNLDAFDIPLDSKVWAGGQLIFVGVRDQKIVIFSGPYKTAYVTSGDVDIGRSLITLAKPIIDNGTGTVAIASRVLLTDQVEFGTTSTPDADNRCGVRSNGNYHRVKVTPTSLNWKTLTGCEIDIATQGTR